MSILKRFKPFETAADWHFKDPDPPHHIYSAPNREQLLKQIVAYREQNELPPIQALERVVENYLCGLPANCTKCEGYEVARGWFTYIRGGIALAEMVLFKRIAPQDVAEARAAQCLTCDLHLDPKTLESVEYSDFDKFADDLAEKSTQGKTVSTGPLLGLCSGCKCVLRSKVFYGGKPSLSDKEAAEMRAVGCWQLKP